MMLFHGSKKKFDKFDHKYIETGERAGREVFGFWFLDNIYGAGYHAEVYAKGPSEDAVVYICEIPDDKPTLTLNIPVRDQPHYELWDRKMPLAISAVANERDWFRLMFESKVYNKERHTDRDRLKLLHEAGFIAVHDFELGYGDGHYHSLTTIVMDVNQIRILDIVHTNSQKYEQLKYHCQIALGFR